MKKITFIITGLAVGGAETMLLKLLQNIDRSIFDVTVICLSNRGALAEKFETNNIKVYSLNMKSGLPSPFKFIKLIKLLHYLKPDLVQTWMYHADLLGGLASRLLNVRSVVWNIRQADISLQGTKKLTSFITKICAFISNYIPAHILTCSNLALKVHSDIGYNRDKMDVIPNGFDLQFFQRDHNARLYLRSELGIPFEAPVIGIVGRYDPLKNHQGFIHMAQMVLAEKPDTHFLLAGTGIDYNNSFLVEAIAQTGYISNFHLLGRRDDIPAVMSTLDVLVSSSHSEAFPNVLGEAMACEVPCAVTDVGDSAEIVGSTGRVVSAGNMDALALKSLELLSLTNDEKILLGQSARQRVIEYFDIKKIVGRYQDLYLKLLQEV